MLEQSTSLAFWPFEQFFRPITSVKGWIMVEQQPKMLWFKLLLTWILLSSYNFPSNSLNNSFLSMVNLHIMNDLTGKQWVGCRSWLSIITTWGKQLHVSSQVTAVDRNPWEMHKSIVCSVFWVCATTFLGCGTIFSSYFTECSLNIVFISKNCRKFATTPSPALGCYWLYKILPANRSDWSLALRWELWRSLTAM